MELSNVYLNIAQEIDFENTFILDGRFEVNKKGLERFYSNTLKNNGNISKTNVEIRIFFYLDENN